MPLDIRVRFGRAIRRIRQEQEINQEEAAERCGLHRTYLQRHRAGRQESFSSEHREGRKGFENEPAGIVWPSLKL